MKKLLLAFAILIGLPSAECHAQCGNMTDIDGHVYTTVQIGTQCWMQENLKTLHYRDGSAIVPGNDSAIWVNDSTGAWCDYAGSATNDSIYGKLYNWYAVHNPRGLCPGGWHIADSTEWMVLVNFLGGYMSAGAAMKATNLWRTPDTATNSSGFTALLGGERTLLSTYYLIQNLAVFWSTTLFQGNAMRAYDWNMLYNTTGAVNDNDYNELGSGNSSRCLSDSLRTGIEDVKHFGDIQVFPVPSVGSFAVMISAPQETPVSIEISDIAGRLIESLDHRLHAGVNQLNMNIDTKGIYFIKVTKTGTSTVRRIVIE